MTDQQYLLAPLIEHRVEFVVIGGFAAVAYGVTLVTHDLDVCCDFSASNLLRLQEALGALHPVHRMPPAKPPLVLTRENTASLKNLYLRTDYGQLDCLSTVEGIGDFSEVEEHAIEISLRAGACKILSLDALIQAKEAMGKPRDKAAVVQLKAIRERTRCP